MFSAFPSGWPGAGLLVLRSSLGATIVAHGIACLWAWRGSGLPARVFGIVAVASGVFLVIGYLTPLASLLAGLTIVGAILSLFEFHSSLVFDSKLAMDLATSIAVAIVCLGPGAFSVDARLFGRREIIIPSASTLPKT